MEQYTTAKNSDHQMTYPPAITSCQIRSFPTPRHLRQTSELPVPTVFSPGDYPTNIQHDPDMAQKHLMIPHRQGKMADISSWWGNPRGFKSHSLVYFSWTAPDVFFSQIDWAQSTREASRGHSFRKDVRIYRCDEYDITGIFLLAECQMPDKVPAEQRQTTEHRLSAGRPSDDVTAAARCLRQLIENRRNGYALSREHIHFSNCFLRELIEPVSSSIGGRMAELVMAPG
ncbi:hypothetical protein ACRALDRAFT_208672 [Sodiomyces alcalophilus JCM 7366]|uniref:uncharacterized protein n=1 Tax=Sodiomyces alcalophilus JCM 7366 TaxID=591952 RepID=UPI0039B37124